MTRFYCLLLDRSHWANESIEYVEAETAEEATAIVKAAHPNKSIRSVHKSRITMITADQGTA